jgi:TPR repeat protein
MTALGRTDGRHTGDSLPFWQQACEEDRPTGCKRLIQLEAMYCGDSSAWACNELGRQYATGTVTEADPDRALGYFSRACELRFQAGCLNLLSAGRYEQAPPKPLDLRLLLREGGKNLMDMPEPELYARACEHAWTFACARVSQ